jgi:outer membrane protein assembly complex protein YaeT
MSRAAFCPVSRLVCGLALGVCFLTNAGCREEQGGVEVKDLSFTGVKAVSAKQIKSVLATAESEWLPWGEKQYFTRDQFEADLKRIQAFYKDRGYPEARVRSYDVKLSDDQKSVRITVDIAEGEPIRVERIVLEGFGPLPAQHTHALEQNLPLKQGQPLDRALLQASREAALDELKDHGYPYATVLVSEENGSTDHLRVLTLSAEPGAAAYFGPIEISGNSSVSDRIVRRQLTFRPGELFQQSKLRESQRKLYTLELFEFVNIQPVGAENKVAEVPSRVTLTEGKHRKVDFGFGYGTEEKLRAEVDWRHVNFFGGARTAGVFARYSSLDRGVRLNFRQPYFFSPRYSFSLSGQSWFSDEPAFVLTTIGGRATVTREFTRSGGPVLRTRQPTLLAATYVNEWEDYTISEEALNDPSFRDELIALGLDPDTGSATGRLSAVLLDASHNTTENLLDAHRGYVAILHLEKAGGFLGGDWRYYEVSAEGRFYQALGRLAVVAVRARGGSIDGKVTEEQPVPVPFFKLYFLGGSTNLRGWGRYEVAPLDDGLPVGGKTFANFSTEVRFPLWRNLSAVAFFDGGNVWTNSWDFNLNDLRYDAGPGLRYNTPIGPFRLDVGFQLNPIPGLLVNGEPQKRSMRVHFSFGQAF